MSLLLELFQPWNPAFSHSRLFDVKSAYLHTMNAVDIRMHTGQPEI